LTENKPSLRQAVASFPNANILVIGDIIVDHFIWGSVSRISPEAPVPVVNVTRENLLMGGAANVLHNLYALGAHATLCGAVGDDAMADHLFGLLNALDSPTEGVMRLVGRPTTLKTRIIAQSQQVVRFDREQAAPLPEETVRQLMAFVDQRLDTFDAVIISDYDKGMISPQFMEQLMQLLATHPTIPVIADPKPGRPERFRGITLLTPNHHEAELLAGIAIVDDDSLSRAAQTIIERLDIEAILITRGEAGMALLEKGSPITTIPTVAKEVYDVTGAGDTVIATLSLGLAGGLPLALAAALANYAAGIVVGKIGTATATAQELLEVLP
jgi:D-beta-D-heptose 7-phosphate kinase/D-beta-D-heptose 1-phosphate adenosyltransferase